MPPAMDQPLLSVRNLKTFFVMDEGTAKAVDGVSFDVQPGQVVGIVGESGCGKSVTVKSVLRIVQKPGRIVGGEILFRRTASGRRTVDARPRSSISPPWTPAATRCGRSAAARSR